MSNRWIDNRYIIPNEIRFGQSANDIKSLKLDDDLDINMDENTCWVSKNQVLIAAALVLDLEDPLTLVNFLEEQERKE